MEREFGKTIVFLVKGVTKLGTLKYRGHERHVESLRKFFIAIANDLRVVIIKFADRLHNLRTLEHVREDKQKRIALESIEIYAPLANRLGMGKLKSELEEAAFPFAYPKEYQEVCLLLEERKEEFEKHTEQIKEKLETLLKENNISYEEISHRVKTKYSLWKKLQRYEMNLERIHDIVALRVVVENIEDCYRVLGLIHSLWKPLQGRIKDYISLPKLNGYRALHTTVFAGEYGIAEIQIKTKEMHAEAAYGIAAHFAYKEKGSKKAKEDQGKFEWIEQLKELNYNPEKPQSFFEHLRMDFFNDRIFIRTPKGDVVDLPEGSSPIDFAYSIHSDIGDHVSGVKINGKLVQMFSVLKNGDIVEIITKKEANPSRKWLEHAKTNLARKHIKAYLERSDTGILSRLRNFRNYNS
jgi:GTP pyrophosphokinase